MLTPAPAPPHPRRRKKAMKRTLGAWKQRIGQREQFSTQLGSVALRMLGASQVRLTAAARSAAQGMPGAVLYS